MNENRCDLRGRGLLLMRFHVSVNRLRMLRLPVEGLGLAVLVRGWSEEVLVALALLFLERRRRTRRLNKMKRYRFGRG